MSADSHRVCPRCQAAIPEIGSRLCPACLLRLALEAPGDDGAESVWPSYRVLAVLAADSSRTTYLAQGADRSFVTLQVTRASVVPGLTPALFEERIAELAALRHPSIVSVLDGLMTEAGDFCVVSLYVAGRSLAHPDALRGVASDQVIGVFDALCAAVRYAHDRRTAHGNLVPSSVVLVGGAARPSPRLTAFDVRSGPQAIAEDIAALRRLEAMLSAARPDASPLLQRSRGHI